MDTDKIIEFMYQMNNGVSEEDAGSLAYKACDEFGLWNVDDTIPEWVYSLAYEVMQDNED